MFGGTAPRNDFSISPLKSFLVSWKVLICLKFKASKLKAAKRLLIQIHKPIDLLLRAEDLWDHRFLRPPLHNLRSALCGASNMGQLHLGHLNGYGDEVADQTTHPDHTDADTVGLTVAPNRRFGRSNHWRWASFQQSKTLDHFIPKFDTNVNSGWCSWLDSHWNRLPKSNKGT